MAQPTQLNATEQDTLVKQIGLALLRAAPRDWRRVTVEYRAVGRYHEMSGQVHTSDGQAREWVATHDIATLFSRLRAGMYRDGRGTWFNARYQLEHPSSYNLEYDREEPSWDLMPPPQAYADELRMFPRAEENVPEWLMRRLAGLGPERPGPQFRVARIFDGAAPSSRPILNRSELDTEEQDHLLAYLDEAPVVVPGRGYDIDRLAEHPESTVPVAFHSDGTWIWPAAVNYYLREYGVAPESALLEHIRGNGYTLSDVPEHLRQAAGASINRGGPAPPASQEQAHAGESQQRAEGNETTAAPGAPAHAAGNRGHAPYGAHEADHRRHDTDVDRHGQHTVDDAHRRRHSADEATRFTASDGDSGPPAMAAPDTAGAMLSAPATGDEAAPWTQGTEHAPHARPETEAPQAGQPQTETAQPPLREPSEPVLDQLRAKLAELDVANQAYSIGEPAEQCWCLEQVESGWRVGWYERELTNPAIFGDADDAAAFLLGKVLLTSEGAPAPQQGPEASAVSTPAEPAPSVRTTLSPGVATGGHASHAQDTHDSRPRRAVPEEDTQSGHRQPAAASSGATAISGTPPPPQAPPQHRRAEAQRTEQRAPTSGGQQWPIQPLASEPPLTLFRGKEMREVPAGSELDRFGGPSGNLTYVAGTPFEERSLVPEWVDRPYHVYRVQRPLDALTGVAIPWFNQPGGGAAYLLPASIEELLASGDLIELEPGEPPIE